jgi:hypothetical protein
MNREPEQKSSVGLESWSDLSLLSGILILFFVGSLFAISSLLFLFGLPVLKPTSYFGIVTAVFCGWRIALKHFTARTFIRALLVFAATLTISIVLGSLFFDVSWDGQTYHQEAVIQLANGWNPVFEKALSNNGSETYAYLWARVLCFPKAQEIAQACLYLTTHRIESAKAINLLLLSAAFYLTFSCLYGFKEIGLSRSLFFAAIAALNPVTISQSLTFYVDGALASASLCFLSLMVLFFRKPQNYLAFILALMAVYFINIKFTGIIFFGVGAAGFMVIAFLNRQWDRLKNGFVIFALSFVFGVFIFGYNPYVINSREHGHPFYPLMGREKTLVDFMSDRPAGFDRRNRFERLAISLFAKPTIGEEAKITFPLMFTKKELFEFFYPDVKCGGFGPLFSGILVLSLVGLSSGLTNFRENKNFYLVILFLVFSVLIHPECWFARYAPQLWLVPILSFAFLGFNRKTCSVRPWVAAGMALVFFNVSLIGLPYAYRQLKSSHTVQEQLKELSRRKMPLNVDFFQFRSNRIRLNEYQISYIESQDIPVSNRAVFFGSPTRVKPTDW